MGKTITEMKSSETILLSGKIVSIPHKNQETVVAVQITERASILYSFPESELKLGDTVKIIISKVHEND